MPGTDLVKGKLKDLRKELETLNTYCQHLDVEIFALLRENANKENRKLSRRLSTTLGIAQKLKTDTAQRYQDKSYELNDLLKDVDDQYDDLRRRYVWALFRIAEMKSSGKRYKLAQENLSDDLDLQRGVHNQNGQVHGDRVHEEDDSSSIEDEEKQCVEYAKSTKKSESGISSPASDASKVKSLSGSPVGKKQAQAVHQFLGMGTKTEGMLLSKMKKTRGKKYQGSVYTQVTCSPYLTTIEEFPMAVEASSSKSDSPRSLENPLKKLRHSKKNKKKDKEAREIEATSRLETYALLKEIEERDETIDCLLAQMKIKDTQIAQLSDVIRTEKLGLK